MLRHSSQPTGLMTCASKTCPCSIPSARNSVSVSSAGCLQRTENKMAGETRVRSDACRLEIANLADHDDVWCLAQDRTQRSWKGHADFRVHLHLVDACHLVLDRLFYGDDFAVRFVDVIETSVKRGRFSRAGRSGHQENSIREPHQTLERF